MTEDKVDRWLLIGLVLLSLALLVWDVAKSWLEKN